VSSQIFCAAVVRNISSNKEWGLKIWRSEGVITNTDQIVLFGPIAELFDINHFKSWVSRSFNPDKLGFRL